MANTSGKTVPAATMPIEVAHAKSRKAVRSPANGVSLASARWATQLHIHVHKFMYIYKVRQIDRWIDS
jgi:hypothetical protein